MTVHVNDIGTVVRQQVTDIADLTGYTITLRVRRPDASTTSVAGSPDGDECTAIVPAGVWTLEGQYRVQFQLSISGTSFALATQTLDVRPRV